MTMQQHPLVKSFIASLACCFVLAACATDPYGNKRPFTDAEKGAFIGATIGLLAGLTTKDKKKKSVLYGIVGGIAGGLVGNYMDNQKKDFEKQLQNEINRGDITVYKSPQNVIEVTMTAQTTFDVNATSIKAGFTSTLDKIAGIVNKYGKTHLSLVGHTDSTGSASYNQKLSERRAASVKNYLLNVGVIPQRLSSYGVGESEPRASNTTASGRTLNRRVVIIIEPIIEGEQE